MKNKKIKVKKGLLLLSQIEKIRSKNNKNWMDVLKLSLELDFDRTAKIIKDTPFPMPREVICSPNQSKNITEPTKVTTVVILKKTPGLFTSDPDDPEVLSNATAKPYACTVASKTVKYLVY